MMTPHMPEIGYALDNLALVPGLAVATAVSFSATSSAPTPLYHL